MKLCRAQKADGTPCNAPAGLDSDFCFHHDPNRKEQADRARQKATEAARSKRLTAKSGGSEERRRLLKNFRLNSLADVKRLLAATINAFTAGEITADDARCIAYVANILTQTIKDTEIEGRLKELEDRIRQTGVVNAQY